MIIFAITCALFAAIGIAIRFFSAKNNQPEQLMDTWTPPPAPMPTKKSLPIVDSYAAPPYVPAMTTAALATILPTVEHYEAKKEEDTYTPPSFSSYETTPSSSYDPPSFDIPSFGGGESGSGGASSDF